jgi:hypothetical protein
MDAQMIGEFSPVMLPANLKDAPKAYQVLQQTK